MMHRPIVARAQHSMRHTRDPNSRFQKTALWLALPRPSAAGSAPKSGHARARARALACVFFAFTLTLALGCAGGSPSAAEAAGAARAEAAARTEALEPGSGSPEIGKRIATPPLYRVSGGAGADLVLLGTIHLGPAAGWSLSPETEASIRNASTIVLELDPKMLSEESVSTLIANMVMLDPPSTLKSVLRPETAKLLDEMDSTVTAMGLPRGTRKYMKPWFVAAALIESATSASGYPSSEGVEGLIEKALGDRPLIPLETFEMQLRIFDDLSAELQDVMLYDTLLRLDETAEGIEELVAAWRTADIPALEEIAREGIEELPKLELFYQHLLDDRNARWHTQLIPLLEDRGRRNETILVGVGALHLVGPKGVPSLLRKAGYAVSAIPQTSPVDD